MNLVFKLYNFKVNQVAKMTGNKYSFWFIFRFNFYYLKKYIGN